MSDDMDFEYTINHADKDSQRGQAERDEEARLVFLSYDELDLILSRHSRDAEEAIELAARQTPRPQIFEPANIAPSHPEVIPKVIAPPQPIQPFSPEEENLGVAGPDSIQVVAAPPKIYRLRLKGEGLKQLLAQKKQTLLTEKAFRGRGIDLRQIPNDNPPNTSATPSLPSYSEQMGATDTTRSLAAHSQHQILPDNIAPVSFSMFDAPRSALQASGSMINPGGVQPLRRANYMEWPNGQPVAGSNRANAPLHAPLGPKAYSHSRDYSRWKRT
ncbi:hypothetical protein EG327_007414 [Venturia inaequalis]|uniref:Uncharacterized protein n=1 Tax=Venturia inaequalis TaxID=5025 RepID=A0A8H3V076_VENIN|nr:hypothetical protein EG327_007414 [Venturia inaequalis]